MAVVVMMRLVLAIFEKETSLTVTPSLGRERFSDSTCRWAIVLGNTAHISRSTR